MTTCKKPDASVAQQTDQPEGIHIPYQPSYRRQVREDKRISKALDLINRYGGIDGAHHKQWVLDQVVRALTGCPMVEKSSIDCNGKPYTFEAQGDSEEYLEWVRQHNDGVDGPETYEWDEGIVP